MPFITKKSYQYFNVSFILMVSALYAFLTHSTKSTSNVAFYGIGFIILIIMSLTLIFLEYKLGIINKFSITIYILVGILLPPLILVSKYSYMIILIIFIPLLIYNLSKQENNNYLFRVDNYYLINLTYLISLMLGVLMILTKQSYYLLGTIFILLTSGIDIIVLNKLYKAKSKTFIRRSYLSLIVLSLTFFLSFVGRVEISSTNQSILTVNFIYPVLSIIFLSISSRFNRSNLLELVNITSIK